MSANPNLVKPSREAFIKLTEELSDNQIAKRLGCSAPTINRWRRNYGLPPSTAKSAGNIKWQTDRAFFSTIDTPAKAYILGLFVADGHVHKRGYGIEISLKESDADLLHRIAAEVGRGGDLGWRTNTYDGSRMRHLYLGGSQLVKDLNILGVHHDKSTTAAYPVIPGDLESHLVRGIWDGDGEISDTQLRLIGTPALLDGVMDAVYRHTGHVLRRRMAGAGRRYHYACGSRRDAPVLHWMYADADIALARKREKYLRYWTEVPRTESLNLPVGAADAVQAGSAADYPCHLLF